MKVTDKDKQVNAMPKGVWEGSNPARNKEKTSTTSVSTDLQGNGYPINKQSK